MRVDVVTSFSPAGAEQYGDRCVESLTRYWPHPVVVYVDEPRRMPGVVVRGTDEIPGWRATKAILPATRPDAAGTGTDVWTRKPANYIWNAQRFAVKPFVWLHAAERVGRGALVWVDGDTVTTEIVPAGLPAEVLGDADIAYMGRGSMHPETGCVVFRIPEAVPVLRWCVETYRSGTFRHLTDGWTDCHVLRAALHAVPVTARDLTSHTCAAWVSSVDACARSPWGPYMAHLKGGKKRMVAA